MIGVVFGLWIDALPERSWWYAAVIGSGFVAVLPQKDSRWFRLVCAFITLTCVVCGTFATFTRVASATEAMQVFSGSREVEGTVFGAPIPRRTSQQVLVRLKEGETVLVSAPFLPALHHGDQISLQCRFKTLKKGDDFDLKTYLLSRDLSGWCEQEVLRGHVPFMGASLPRFLLYIRDTLHLLVERVIPPPYSTLLGGFVFGEIGVLPKTLDEELGEAGVGHMLAASGFNVSLVVTALSWVVFCVVKKPVFRYLLVLFGILSYVWCASFTASVLRAAVMGALALLGSLLHRPVSGLRMLWVTVLLISVFQPLLLLHVGFQLSVSATLGLLCLSSWLERGLFWISARFEMRATTAATCSASISTLPVLFWHQLPVSYLGVFANVLWAPFIPLAMLLYPVLAGTGFLPHAFTEHIGSVLQRVLNRWLWLTSELSRLPGNGVVFSEV